MKIHKEGYNIIAIAFIIAAAVVLGGYYLLGKGRMGGINPTLCMGKPNKFRYFAKVYLVH